MEKDIKCASCKVDLTNIPGSIILPCPSCGERDIFRCDHCRDIAARYTCGCGFKGPY